MIRRREFVCGLGGAAAWPLAAQAQQRKAIRRIGVLLLGSGSDPIVRTWVAAFQEGLRQAGWIDNDNLRIELRFAGDASGIRASAEELVKLAPD